MRRAALRTLLVVSERPHPWVFLRDRLDPGLVAVAWTRPSGAGVDVVPWMLAGSGDEPAPGLAGLRGRLMCCRWVGPAPDGLPARALPLPDWHAVAADVERAVAASVAGLRLAPGCGLVLPDGSYLSPAAELEALLACHPEGLDVDAPAPRLRAAARRVGALLDRHRVPLRVALSGGRMALVEAA